MKPLYRKDLAYIQATGFGDLMRGAAPAIVERLRSAPTRISRVFEVGCGAGPLTSVLVESGFEVTAIDASAELLAFAHKMAPAARFVHGSIYEREIPACDAIIACGEPLTYHTETEDADRLIGAFLQRAAQALPNGGQLIFDVIETGEPSLSERTWRSGPDWAVLVDTEEDKSARSLVRAIQTFRQVGGAYRRGYETHAVRLFETETLLSLLAANGFDAETTKPYGAQALPPRRRAFFATRAR